MTRYYTLIATTALALSAAPLMAETSAMKYDAANTLAGQEDQVTVIEASQGGMVVTSDGTVLGVIEDFDIDNQNRAEIIIDLDAETKFLGDRMILNIDPENVTVGNGGVALNASQDALFAQQNSGGTQTSIRVNF